MKNSNIKRPSFIARLIEGQTSSLETFIAFVVIAAISAVLIAIGNYIFGTH